MIKSILLLSLFIASISCSSLYIQLVNALIARSNVASLANTYSNLGFSTVSSAATCTGAAFPTTIPAAYNTLTYCYGTTVAYPYVTSSAGAGLETTLVASWSNALTQNYGRTINVTGVPVVIGTAGLFASLTVALNAGQCNVILSSIFETSARDASYLPSCPYASTGSGVLVGSKAAATPITNLATLNQTGVVIAVAAGASSLAYVRAQFPTVTIILTSSTAESQSFAINGTANAAVGDLPVFSATAQNQTICGGQACTVFSLGNGNSNVVAYSQVDPTASPVAPTGTTPTPGATAAPAGPTGTAPTATATAPKSNDVSSVVVSTIVVISAAIALFM